jgi:iron(III) transport system ATP-binding protein
VSGLILEGVSHRFGDLVAVDGVDLRVESGELVCLLGPSGCGKSTILRLAAGLERLQQGRVLIADREVASTTTNLPPEERGVGLVFQDYALFPHLKVLDNVAFGLDRLAPAERRKSALEMLERVGMAVNADTYPHTLSGGEQQRVALARALAPRPGLMLMDEPFSDLDIRLRDHIRDETLDLVKAQGISTLLVTHDPEEAMRMADRIALMRKGRIVQEGTPGQLYSQPADAFAAGFFGEINILEGIVEAKHVVTPLGEVAANGLAEGSRVAVFVRPEGLAVAPADDREATATVALARPLGPFSLVSLRLDVGGAALESRLPVSVPPPEGARVRITLDSTKAFVFPRDEVHMEDVRAAKEGRER